MVDYDDTVTSDRMRAYRRVFGYTNVDPSAGARPNPHDTLVVNGKSIYKAFGCGVWLL